MEDYTSGKLKAYVEVRGGVVSLDLSGNDHLTNSPHQYHKECIENG